MARKPAVMTAGWQEVSDSLARTGVFEDNQLNPETVPGILGDFVRRCTTIIGYRINSIGVWATLWPDVSHDR